MDANLIRHDDWVPTSCTLPTVELPLRRAEFDDLFAHDVVSVRQLSSCSVQLELRGEPDVAARAAGLAVKESGCCSFFRFDLTTSDGKVIMIVSADPANESVIGALTARANEMVGASE